MTVEPMWVVVEATGHALAILWDDPRITVTNIYFTPVYPGALWHDDLCLADEKTMAVFGWLRDGASKS